MSVVAAVSQNQAAAALAQLHSLYEGQSLCGKIMAFGRFGFEGMRSPPTDGIAPVGAASTSPVRPHEELLRQLQTLATAILRGFPPTESEAKLMVLFIVNAAYPWVLVESVQFLGRKRMSYFDSPDRIRCFLKEWAAWQRADKDFAARHMTTPGGFPGVTTDWVHSNDFEVIFGPQREARRNKICTTAPNEIVTSSMRSKHSDKCSDRISTEGSVNHRLDEKNRP